MSFKELLIRAKDGSHEAEEEILSLYGPLLMKESIQNGAFASARIIRKLQIKFLF